MVAITLFVGRLLAPNKPNPEKLSSYECGEEPVGSSWIPFNPRFYVIALVFLLFDVEMVFIFPWATVFGSHHLLSEDARWGKLTLIEMFIFMGILILGLVYVWRKGDLNWIKPDADMPHTTTSIPNALYDRLNLEQANYQVKAFSLEAPKDAPVMNTPPAEPVSTVPPVRKPMFKPTFKKPGNES